MKQLLLTLAIALCMNAQAQIPAKPSLEELNALVDSSFCEDAGSTSAINNCYEEMGKKYELVLNDLYKQLLKKIPTKYKAMLIESERKWIAYKDADIRLRQNLEVKHGSAQGRLMGIFKERAEYISWLLETRDY